MGISKRAMGVEGFEQTPRPFPSTAQLSRWALQEIRYGRMLAKFVEVKINEKEVLVTYKLGNDKLIEKKIRYGPIDEAIDQESATRLMIAEAFK